jgi:bifunctional DNA-binding transcriptional regulator/antitoxin component of YhaV-PrlF toxin-antitoxin module
MKESSDDKEITKTWLTGNSSCTLVIPKNLAKAYRLDKPTHIVIEKRPDGLLIRKLEVV